MSALRNVLAQLDEAVELLLAGAPLLAIGELEHAARLAELLDSPDREIVEELIAVRWEEQRAVMDANDRRWDLIADEIALTKDWARIA